MKPIDDVEFDHLLRDAMRSRPEPRAMSNLAHRAIALAREQVATAARKRLERLAGQRRRNRWLGLVATLLIAGVVALGAKKLSDSGALDNSSASATTSDSTSSDSSSTSSSTITVGAALTAELLVVALILLSASMASPRPDDWQAVSL